MPPIIREIEQAAIGCWMLICGKDAGQQRFDLSIDGFWRSFYWAFLLVVLDSINTVVAYLQTTPGGEDASSGSIIGLLLVNAIASLLTFFVFPIVVGALARPMGLTKRYATYIIVRNWFFVFVSLFNYLVYIASGFDVLPDELRGPLTLSLVFIVLFAATAIAHILLTASRPLAFGFALLDFLLALLISQAADRLIS